MHQKGREKYRRRTLQAKIASENLLKNNEDRGEFMFLKFKSFIYRKFKFVQTIRNPENKFNLEQ